MAHHAPSPIDSISRWWVRARAARGAIFLVLLLLAVGGIVTLLLALGQHHPRSAASAPVVVPPIPVCAPPPPPPPGWAPPPPMIAPIHGVIPQLAPEPHAPATPGDKAATQVAIQCPEVIRLTDNLGWSCAQILRIRWIDYGFGESPPMTISVSHSASSQKDLSWVECGTTTLPIDRSDWCWASLGILLFWISLVAALVVVPVMGILFVDNLRNVRKDPTLLIFMGTEALMAAGVIALVVCCGYWGGAPMILDNASSQTVAIRLNGEQVAVLPPCSHFRIRFSGDDHLLEVFSQDRVIERTLIDLDHGLKNSLVRAVFGCGTLVYNVQGANSYRVAWAHYQ